MAFREFSDGELGGLSDEELLAYMVDARAAGKDVAASRALMFLVYGYLDTLVMRARLKLPPDDAEDVAAEALASAIRSKFDGTSKGEFRSWVHQILSRRIADHYRRTENDPDMAPLASEHGDDEDVRGVDPGRPFEGTALDVRKAIKEAYEELEKDEHRQVVDEVIFKDRPPREVAEEIPGMTEANVHQITSRFRRRIREILERGDTSP